MKFRIAKQQIISILEASQGTNFVTVGSQKQSKGSKENLNLPRVTVYYQNGSFPRTGSNFQSVKQHNASYRIEFTVVMESEVDLSVLNNPGSTPAQIAAALAAMPELSDQVDNKMDEVFDNVYQILMRADNYDLNLLVGEVTDRYIDNFQKDSPVPRGEFMILTANCTFTMNMEETVDGEIGEPGVNVDTTIDLDEDQGNNFGVDSDLI